MSEIPDDVLARAADAILTYRINHGASRTRTEAETDARAALEAAGWAKMAAKIDRYENNIAAREMLISELEKRLEEQAKATIVAQAECDRLRDGIASALSLEEDLLDVFNDATDEERLSILTGQILQMSKTIRHYEEAAVINGYQRDGARAALTAIENMLAFYKPNVEPVGVVVDREDFMKMLEQTRQAPGEERK